VPEIFGIDEMVGLRRVRAMQGNDVGNAQELVERGLPET